MKKKTHILITGRIACRTITSHDKALLWGSILPDLMFFTYLRSHTWNNTHKIISRKMKRLSRTGCNGGFSALRLGYILHYIEDYFTYAHNDNFKDTIEEHVKYENEQARLIINYLREEVKSEGYLRNDIFAESDKNFTNIKDVLGCLDEMHAEYMKNRPGMDNDLIYASKAVSMICKYYAYAFAVNEEKFFEFPILPDLDYIVNIPRLVAKISLMSKFERVCLV